MTIKEYEFYASEIPALEKMLAETPEEDVIDRMSLEARLKKVRASIEGIDPAMLPKTARLTFRGAPVFGSHGVAADFAGKAADLFADAFAAIVAGTSENLRYMGPIPDKQKNQLLITGTALGSFGFEFELPAPEQPKDSTQAELDLAMSSGTPPSKTDDAMMKLERLFQSTAEGTDDDVADLLEEVHPRAVKKVADFLGYISAQDAWCGLEFNEACFRFSGREQVESSAKRLACDNVKETAESFTGEFQGALPAGRTFEFKLNNQKGILRGKISPDVLDVNKINHEYLYKPASISLKVIQVGQGRPRYTLEKLEDVKLAA